MKRAKVVIGANFGDEGKGLVTDFLANQAGGDTLVVRHNGGAQAGHTVVTPTGLRHVFHHFGAGTLAGARTFLSQFFVCNPILFMQEAHELMASGLSVRVYIDPRSQVTTPYDMLINQIVEDARGARRHGSCGVGFNETVARSQHPAYAIPVASLANRDALVTTLLAIRDEWVPRRLAEHGNPTVSAAANDLLRSDDTIDRFMKDCRIFFGLVIVDEGRKVMRRFSNVIFEGAQGLLLDQSHHWFPHVTRSNTGLKNAVFLAQEGGIDGLDVTYVTRAYMTRHGAGPFPTEHPDIKIKDETNVLHPYQGDLRFGLLSLDILRASVTADFRLGKKLNARAWMAVTCMDQAGDTIRYAADGGLRSGTPEAFLSAIEGAVKFPVRYTSSGPTRAAVVTME